MPKNLWERVKLPRNYEKALETIDKHLLYWPKLLQHKIKQRLTKMTQMRIRMRKLALKTREKIMTTPRRDIKRELRREEKAVKAAVLDKAIETELLERLKKGIYGDIYNYPELEWNKVLDEEKKLAEGVEEEEEEEEPEIEYVEGYEELEEEEDMEDFPGFPSKMSNFNDDEHDSADEEEDDDDGEEQVVIHKKGKRDSRKSDDLGKSKKKKKRVVVEMEQEDGDVIRTLKTAS